MTTAISVDVVFAAPDSQMVVELKLQPDATVADAIAASGIVETFPQYSIDKMPVGIWGNLTNAGQVLADGDRVEIYRELLIDPMESRRLKASETSPGPHESR